MPDPITITVLEGDETGQELLEQSLRVLDADVLGLPLEIDRHDLSLENRRATSNGVVHEAAKAMCRSGLGIKAATVTPEGKDDVGSPNRILREEIDGKVIIRTGRRIPGVIPPLGGVHYPISVVRMAIEDAYGAEQWREGTRAPATRSPTAPRRSPARRAAPPPSTRSTAANMGAKVYGGPKWTVSPVYEGMLKEELDAAAARHPDVTTSPCSSTRPTRGLITGVGDVPLVIPP
jgi:isocitrate/isopropylmalate dehydrogenase